MKHALKVILPLVLVLALLGTACWYFLFQRPDLTADILLGQAQGMVDKGRYGRAITYYSWAWSLEPERDEIPIQLAQTYVADGNYTKAEYTLVKAISTHPQLTELYVALCQTYVAQDKLLDAVQMLDRTTDATVKAELDGLRPAAPTVSPDSGYYNEYISVTVQADTDTVFVTTDGKYPSTDSDLYTAPITLPAGETTILAVAVDEQGLVSPVVRNGYTIGGVLEEVTLSDSALDQAVREQLGLGPSDPLMSDVLWSVTHLTVPETVTDLSDLAQFTGLQSLTIQNISGLDFTVLSKIPALQELDLSGCTLSTNSLQAVGSLTELRKLTLSGCALSDITAFSQLTKLQELDLSNNILEDVGILSLMLELQTVKLSDNPLTSIAGLSTCAKLQDLDINNCKISSLGALSDKTALQTLLASNNHLKDLDDLAACTALVTLEVNNNQIEDISVLTGMPMLQHFEADQNAITIVPDFDADSCSLVYFGIDYNQVEDVSGLAGINSLNYLNIDYNKVKDLTPLAENANLVQVNAWDNAISEESVEALAEYSIILNYNPNYEGPEAEEAEEE